MPVVALSSLHTPGASSSEQNLILTAAEVAIVVLYLGCSLRLRLQGLTLRNGEHTFMNYGAAAQAKCVLDQAGGFYVI